MSSLREHPFKHFGFLTLPDFSMMCVVNAIDVLRAANDLLGYRHFSWSLYTADGQPARASNGTSLADTRCFDPQSLPDIFFACGGNDIQQNTRETTLHMLRETYRNMVPLGGLCTGSYALAKAGLLDGYRCAVHWESLYSLRELFPQANFTDELFVIDRDRYTCTGGVAPVDLFIHILRPQLGLKVTGELSEKFCLARLRGEGERQHIPMTARLSLKSTGLERVERLMDAYVESPLPIEDIARLVNMSHRQIQRLFRKHFNTTPARHYMNIRLQRARDLLQKTNLSILDVAMACGFSSPGHFSKCYRAAFNISPSAERQPEKASPSPLLLSEDDEG